MKCHQIPMSMTKAFGTCNRNFLGTMDMIDKVIVMITLWERVTMSC